MSKRYWIWLLVLFAVSDLAFTFWRNYQLPLDGDLVAIVLPASWYTQVIHDPFGWTVLTNNAVYGGTNRFFAHAEMGVYWKTVPRLLQHLIDPISSLYTASALFNTLTQAALIFLLVKYIQAGSSKPREYGDFWIVTALLIPLCQTAGGFYEQVGITDRAITYTFFYGFAVVLLLVLLWPFYLAACRQKPLRLSWLRVILLVGLMVVVAFNGPIDTAIVAVLLLCIIGHWAWQQAQGWRQGGAWLTLNNGWLSRQAVLLLGILASLCVYSLYIGRNNIENSHTFTLAQLYQLLPIGVVRYFLYQPELPILWLILLGNYALLRWVVAPSPARQQVLLAMGWAGLFIAAYVLLLPLGGYRSYRPNLLRNDTALPILLGSFFAYGLSTYFLLRQLKGRLWGSYLLLICLVGCFFSSADLILNTTQTNNCERWSLDQLGRAKEPVVALSPYCTVLTWTPITDYTQSDINAQMLFYWGVTTEKKLYYQK